MPRAPPAPTIGRVLLYVVVACEIGFWVVMVAGLAARYLLGLKRTSAVLLLCTPLIDLTLLAASIADVRSGGEPGFRHALAAVYLGYTVAFGHRTVRWADRKAAHLLGQGPPPPKPPTGRMPRFRYELRFWLQIVLMYAVAWAVTGLFALVVADADATGPLVEQMAGWAAVVVVAALWPAGALLFPSDVGEGESPDSPPASDHPTGPGRRGAS